MSEAVLVIKQGIGVLKLLRSYLDPGKRHALEEAVTDHVLSEIPRILHLLEDRIDRVHASGCTPEEASIITYQVIESQQRTLDEEKRRRLSNVLVNGLCVPRWDRRLHRLLIRLTAEIEEEHIALLQWYGADTPEERARIHAAQRDEPSRFVEMSPNVWNYTPEGRKQADLEEALTRELISRGLLVETTEAKVRREHEEEHFDKGLVDDVELEWDQSISSVGRSLLAYLADPEAASAAP